MKTILIFLIVFSVIVVVHEFGHYYFAKRAGILVREFSIGMGPKLFSQQAESGTTFTIRMLPLGGYVRLAGMGEEADEVQPGMTAGLTLNEDSVVEAINTSSHSTNEELPLQVDEVDLSREMFISGITLGQDELVRFPVSKTANIIEPDGTFIPVAPIERTYERASVKSKILTNIAGPINNFILAILTFMIVGFMIPGIPTGSNQIGDVIENSSAQVAGLKGGDRIVEIDGHSVTNWNDLTSQIMQHPDETVAVVYERQGQAHEVEVNIDAIFEDGSGQSYGQLGVTQSVDTHLLSRLKYGFTQTWAVIVNVVGTIIAMLTRRVGLNQLGGPVAIAQITGQVVQENSFVLLLQFVGMLSANLGMMNLLPVPALDGGKIVLNIIEGVRGKPLSQEKEGIITIIGVGLLLLLMIVVTWNDIMRLLR
ncbi:RIP metalloprotease RseP [Dolosicoccus paucivorans]|uniref:RIP metalloprotease RseP n=1 Tax=Dolosicoccus paucivorans TaxID=84521 RepID=UPI00088C1178|nr:RIP metalloprotease RseP [Dolosicoccus paucivorans]PMB83703.1 RIP metalloprotease RseP [Dolosicoccus paucivorans]SDI44574.1 regulator of sigma E protease [Dolosicoccus paucivorans]